MSENRVVDALEKFKKLGVNMELTDEMMAMATGGTGCAESSPRFNVGDLVYMSNGNGTPLTTEIIGKILSYEPGDFGWVYTVEFIKHPTDPGIVNEGLFEWLLVPV